MDNYFHNSIFIDLISRNKVNLAHLANFSIVVVSRIYNKP